MLLSPQDIAIAAGAWPFAWPAQNAAELYRQRVYGAPVEQRSLEAELEALAEPHQMRLLLEKYAMTDRGHATMVEAIDRRPPKDTDAPYQLTARSLVAYQGKTPKAVLLTKLVLRPETDLLWQPEPIPLYGRLEAAAHMIVQRVPHCLVHAVRLGKPYDFSIELTEESERAVRKVAQDFATRVQHKKPPPPDGTAVYDKLLADCFPSANGDLLRADAEGEHWANEYADASLRNDTKRARLAEQELKRLIGPRAGLLGQGWKVTWKEDGAGLPQWKKIAHAVAEIPEKVRIDDHFIDRFRSKPVRKFRFTQANATSSAEEEESE